MPLDVQDIAMITVPCEDGPSAHTAAQQPDRMAAAVTLLAVSTRAAKIEIFAWPPRLSMHGSKGETQGEAEVAAADAGQEHKVVLGSSAAVPEARGETPSPDGGHDAAAGFGTAPPQPLGPPLWLVSLQVPRGQSSAVAQVQWTPICWLSDPPAANASHSALTGAAAAEQGGAGALSESGEPAASGGDGSAGPAAACSAWLLAGLATGGVVLWKVSVDLGRLPSCAVASCVGQPVPSAPPLGPPSHSTGKRPAASSSDGSWRSRSNPRAETVASSNTWRATGGSPARSAGPSQEPPSGWRQPAVATAHQVNVHMPDVHSRMLFTLHAFADTEPGGAHWRVATTSYDRKIVSWRLQLDVQALAARMQPVATWHGTGSHISAMCSVPVRPQEPRPFEHADPLSSARTSSEPDQSSLNHMSHCGSDGCKQKRVRVHVRSETASLFVRHFTRTQSEVQQTDRMSDVSLV